jgi:glycosyltransferase involved in cell wall biosynthesis
LKFSICIPNYNYARYIGETIQSALDQTGVDLEINVADNCSTDGSVGVVTAFRDDRIRIRVNHCNVGFGRNLDKVGQMAEGDVMIMLSSDDRIMPGALEQYRRILEHADEGPSRAIVCSSAQIIDENGNVTGEVGFPHRSLWTESDRVAGAGVEEGVPLYRVAGSELLRRSMKITENPLNFLATAYPRNLYERVEGYGGGRLFAPDKWFHWRLLAEPGTTAFFVKKPLFQYRWHGRNQVAQQKRSGALKLIVDEYLDTVETTDEMLGRAGLTRQELLTAFLEWDVVRRGVYELGVAGRQEALRIYRFGKAAYPAEAIRNAHMWGFGALLCLGPAAAPVARLIRKLYR